MNTNNIISLTTQDSIPQATSGTGTITSVNNKYKIVGVGTIFTTQTVTDIGGATRKIAPGDYIYIKGQNEFCRIQSIESNTELTLDRKFGVDLVGSAFHITPNSKYVEVGGKVLGAVAATIDGKSFAQNETFTFRKDGSGSYGQNKFVPPIDIVATGTTVRVLVDY